MKKNTYSCTLDLCNQKYIYNGNYLRSPNMTLRLYMDVLYRIAELDGEK